MLHDLALLTGGKSYRGRHRPAAEKYTDLWPRSGQQDYYRQEQHGGGSELERCSSLLSF